MPPVCGTHLCPFTSTPESEVPSSNATLTLASYRARLGHLGCLYTAWARPWATPPTA